MWSKIRLTIYGATSLAGLIWPFYFILQLIKLVKNGNIHVSVMEIGTAFFDEKLENALYTSGRFLFILIFSKYTKLCSYYF